MTDLERFTVKVDRQGPNGCWLWTGGKRRNGYGQFELGGRNRGAHQAALILLRGIEIPSDKVIDHLCRNPSCVNPDHLEIVTNLENMRRGKFATATHCTKGHEYTDANTLVAKRDGGRRTERICRRCHADRQNARYHKARAQQGEVTP